MADDLASLTPENADPGPQLPPQAPEPTTTAADVQDIAPAPTAADALLTANFGDKGAEQYNALRNAGRQAPIGVPAGQSPLFGLSGAPSAEGAGNLIGAGLMGLAGHPEAGAEAFQRQQTLALAKTREMRENASEFYTALLPAAFKQFPGRPDLAAAFLQNEAASRGIHINPAVAIKLNQDMIDGKLTPAQLDDEITHGDISTIERLGTHAKFIDDLTKGRAEARAATSNAATAAEKARNAPTEEAAKANELALKAAMHLRTAQRPPTTAELQTLDAGGLEAYQVPIPGAASGYMWTTRPKGSGSATATLTGSAVDAAKEKRVAAEAAARRSEAPLPVSVIDKMSGYDTALDVISQLKKLYEKGSPTDQERQSWLNRVKQEVQYKWGFDMPDNLDEDTALRSLGAITAGRAFIQGRPNQQLMTEIWKHTGQNPLISPDQMRNRLGIMERQVNVQRDATKKYTQMGREDLAESETGAPKPTANAAPAKVTTRADVAALPAGAAYINPADGKVYYKK
jgi:hypothetical protein